MKCPKCNTDDLAGAFCPNCGANLSDEIDSNPVHEMKETPNADQTPLASQETAKVVSSSPTSSSDSAPTGKVVKITLIVVGVLLVVGLIVGVLLWGIGSSIRSSLQGAVDLNPPEPSGLNISQNDWTNGEYTYADLHQGMASMAIDREFVSDGTAQAPGDFVAIHFLVSKNTDEKKFVSQLKEAFVYYKEFYNLRKKDISDNLTTKEKSVLVQYEKIDSRMEKEYQFNRMNLRPISTARGSVYPSH